MSLKKLKSEIKKIKLVKIIYFLNFSNKLFWFLRNHLKINFEKAQCKYDSNHTIQKYLRTFTANHYKAHR